MQKIFLVSCLLLKPTWLHIVLVFPISKALRFPLFIVFWYPLQLFLATTTCSNVIFSLFWYMFPSSFTFYFGLNKIPICCVPCHLQHVSIKFFSFPCPLKPIVLAASKQHRRHWIKIYEFVQVGFCGSSDMNSGKWAWKIISCKFLHIS